jgi:hypothetical protein
MNSFDFELINSLNLSYPKLCKLASDNNIFVKNYSYSQLIELIYNKNKFSFKCFGIRLLENFQSPDNLPQILKIQRFWRTIHPHLNFILYPDLIINTFEPFTLSEISEIESDYQFTIYENEKLYMFDIRYLSDQSKQINPFTNSLLSKNDLFRLQTKIKSLKSNNIDLSIDQEMVSYKQLYKRKLQQLCCVINRLGFSDVDSLRLDMDFDQLFQFYIKMIYIWNVIVSDEFKQTFHEKIFNKTNILQYINANNLDTLRRLVIVDLEKMLLTNYPNDIKTQLVIYILIGLS